MVDGALPSINLLDKYDDHNSESVPEFCIDAGSTGNIARFINHGCDPNLFVQCVLSSHHDLKLARVMLFAADNIPPLQVSYSFCTVRRREIIIKPCQNKGRHHLFIIKYVHVVGLHDARLKTS